MGLGGSIGSALGARDQARSARKARYRMEEYGREAEDIQSRIDPSAQYRQGYASQLHGIMTGEQDFRTDPGYQFRFEEGQRATERGAAARGYNQSGNVLAALQERGQSMASAEYGNIMTRLTDLAGAGAQGAIAGGQAFQDVRESAATGVASARMAQGNAQAAGKAAWGSAIDSGISMAATGGFDMTSMFGGGGGGGTAMRPPGGATNLFSY